MNLDYALNGPTLSMERPKISNKSIMSEGFCLRMVVPSRARHLSCTGRPAFVCFADLIPFNPIAAIFD